MKRKPEYILHTEIVANPEPTDRMKAELAKLNKIARRVYNKPYDALNGKDKTELHFGINTGALKEDEPVAAKSN